MPDSNLIPHEHMDRSLKLLWFSLAAVSALLLYYSVLLLYPYNPIELKGPMKTPNVVKSTDKTVPLVIPYGCTNTVGKPATFTTQIVAPKNAQATIDILTIDFPLKNKGCHKNRKIEIPVELFPKYLRTSNGWKLRFVVKTKVNSVRTITDYVDSEPFRYVVVEE